MSYNKFVLIKLIIKMYSNTIIMRTIKTFFMFLNEDLYKVLFLFAIVPLAGNTVTLAVLLNAKPEKASLAVFLSTVISVVTIPLYIYWYGGF